MILRHRLSLVGLSVLITGSAYAWDFSVSTAGNKIVVNVTGMDNSGGHQTCAGASVDVNGGGANCGVPGPSSALMEFHCNRLGGHTVFVQVYDASTGDGYETRTGTITVSEPPPAGCGDFSFSPQGSMVLTHKYGAEDYPPGQHRDSQVEVLFRWVDVEPGSTMYVKVSDPDDPSSYRTNAPAVDDNLDSGAGTLSTSPGSTGSKELTFAVGSEPISKIYLNTTGFAAGDNYTIKASLNPDLHSDPNFVCNAANGCYESWPVTAWKRVYLEKKEMFRSGVFIARETPAGSNEVLVQIPTGLRWNHVSLRRGDSIRLLHAPRLDGLDFFPGFYFEDAVVAAVDRVPGARNRRLITLATPLSHSYRDDQSYPAALEEGVSDGVGNLAAGTYARNELYLHSSFQSAFVEMRNATQGVQQIPYLPVIRQAHRLANKWFENTPVNALTWARPGNSNVKHVLAGSGEPEPEGGVKVNRSSLARRALSRRFSRLQTITFRSLTTVGRSWVVSSAASR